MILSGVGYIDSTLVALYEIERFWIKIWRIGAEGKEVVSVI